MSQECEQVVLTGQGQEGGQENDVLCRQGQKGRVGNSCVPYPEDGGYIWRSLGLKAVPTAQQNRHWLFVELDKVLETVCMRGTTQARPWKAMLGSLGSILRALGN